MWFLILLIILLIFIGCIIIHNLYYLRLIIKKLAIKCPKNQCINYMIKCDICWRQIREDKFIKKDVI